VSDDPRDAANARRKHRAAEESGMRWLHRQFAATASQSEVDRAIDELAMDATVHGIFVQFPLPAHLDAFEIVDRIPLQKDVDGLSTRSLGMLVRGEPVHAPATPDGIVQVLELYGIEMRGRTITIAGKSVEIARALALLFLTRDAASITLVDPDDPLLAVAARNADILVSAAERSGFLTAEMVKPGATVVDAGYNRTPSGVVGDVDLKSVEPVARAIMPMPGGVGPATIACLLQHTCNAAR
ncbi:MAG: bifunctional 5,10-methylenetetrahydrofolate dehydrogenase/5,10-methenyltetrahydrofolate cyclohydrolase, partial [Vulcanimicrobiaceae bacterium]